MPATAIMRMCPDCKKTLSGDEVICPYCLARLPMLHSRTEKAIPRKKGIAEVSLSPMQEFQMKLQFFPWKKVIIISSILMLFVVVFAIGGLVTWLKFAPQQLTMDEQLATATQLYHQHNYNDAVMAYKNVLAHYPNSAEAYSGMGWSYYRMGRDNEAITAFREAVRLNPAMPDAQLGLGQSAYYLHLEAEALGALHKAIELNPRKAAAYAYLGSTYFRQEKFPEAIAAFDHAVKFDPTDTESLDMMVRALVMTGQYQEAITPLERIVERHPSDVTARQHLAQAYQETGRYEDAIHHLRVALKHKPDDFDLTVMLGKALYSVGKNTEAMDLLSSAAGLNHMTPSLAVNYHLLGMAQYNQENYQEALKYFYATVTLDNQLAQAYVDLGLTLTKLNQCAEAQSYIEQGFLLDETLSPAHSQDALAGCQ